MSNLFLRLTWSRTEDYFDIEVENPEFAQWFVKQCNTSGNSFEYIGDRLSQDQCIQEAKNNIQEVNQFLKKINFPEITLPNDMYSQQGLNAGHKSWISVIRREPRIDQLLYYHSPELFKKFHDINLLIHKIEKNFKYNFFNNPRWRVDNAFKNVLPTYGVYNVSIKYVDWGKSSWDKFNDMIEEPNDFELSNWINIGSSIEINLSKPYTLAFPQEYLDYCSTHQVSPTIIDWPLGNLVDYTNNIHTARNIMNKNIQMPNNNLRFSIVQ